MADGSLARSWQDAPTWQRHDRANAPPLTSLWKKSILLDPETAMAMSLPSLNFHGSSVASSG
jgi:hypothetical protein